MRQSRMRPGNGAVSDYRLIGHLTLRRILADAKLGLYAGHAIKLEGWRSGYGEVTNTCLFALFLMTLGIVCLFYPQRFRELNLKLRGSWIKPMPSLLGNRTQLWNIRISGAGA